MLSARSDQQALSCAQLELAFVLAQLHAADQAAAKHKTATRAVIVRLQQQLASAQAQLQQQCQATTAAQLVSKIP
jgi:hypothetical protein